MWLQSCFVFLFFIFFFSPITEAQEKGTKLRVLSLNIYGKKEKSCKSRFKAIADHIKKADPPYDVISFNEHYNPKIKLWLSCDGGYLTKLIRKDARYRGKGKSNLHKPRGKFFQLHGANSLFTRHEITESMWKRFRKHRRILANGFMLNRIKINEKLEVDIWTIHVESSGSDGCPYKCRASQVDDLHTAMIENAYDNPTFIMGDFNIGGPFNYAHRDAHDNIDAETFPYPGNDGYDYIVPLLGNSKDVWIEANPNFKDGGYTFDCWNNNTIKSKCSYRERIDYIFQPTEPWFQGQSHSIKILESNIVKWKTPKGQDVSDHYGVDATFLISDKK